MRERKAAQSMKPDRQAQANRMALPRMTSREFATLAAFIKQKSGIHLKDEKQQLLTGRLWPLLEVQQMDSYEAYYRHLLRDPSGAAFAELMNRVTTNHTFFMREEAHFAFFRQRVIPELEATVPDRDLRIWSAGCSTGEEAYTLAMILEDYFAGAGKRWDKKLLATDISGKALGTAQLGEYGQDALQALPAHWLHRYFEPAKPGFRRVGQALRAEVVFRRLNLMDAPFPFKRQFHVIFCRNVMIYFDSAVRQKLVNRFAELLAPGGYLFIGLSETLNRGSCPLRYLQPAVYRKE